MDFDCGDETERSKVHFWGGALTGGASVPFSWMIGGLNAAIAGIKGAIVGGLLGLNIFEDDAGEDGYGNA